MSQNTYIIGLCSPLKFPLEQKILQNNKRICVNVLKFTSVLAHSLTTLCSTYILYTVMILHIMLTYQKQVSSNFLHESG
jgi:hypothetical protein